MKPCLRPNPSCLRCDGIGLLHDRMCDCWRESVAAIVGSRVAMFPTRVRYQGKRMPITELELKALGESGGAALAGPLAGIASIAYGDISEARGVIAASSSPGSGKTTTILGALAEIRRTQGDRVSIRARNLTMWYGAMRDSFDSDEKGLIADEMRQCGQCDVLLLDDLGATGKWTDWMGERLYEVLTQRCAGGRLTFVTTNLDRAEFAETVGTRTASRLTELCDWVQFPEIDLRVRG